MRLKQIAIFTAGLLWSLADALPSNDDLTVRTRSGTVRGKVDVASPDVRQFLSIPYAQPPVKNLRFAPPKPALPFGQLDAKKLGPSCIQYMSKQPRIDTELVTELNLNGLSGTTGPISEDCLTLSIWAPRGTKKNLPVLLWFYGGAFAQGGVDAPYLLPPQWIQRTKSHIVVSFNHRDNIFGFPNAAGLPLEKQNVGLLDQRLAIEWVRDNIAAFGGDPKRIGAWGESSGACGISYYSYQYVHDPIINSMILDSGNEFIDILTRDDAHGNFTYVASQVGCGNLTAAAELACMRKVDAIAIEDIIYKYTEAGNLPYLTFSPIIDNRTIFEDYTARAQAGKIAKLPALIGSNAQDGISFVPYDPNGVDMAAADLITSYFFFCPSLQATQVRLAANTGPVYRFLYSGNFTNVSPKPWMGAYHGSELPMLFGTHAIARGPSTKLEVQTSEAMQDAWVQFVASAGRKMAVRGWDDWDVADAGRVAEFGNGVPARLVDLKEMEAACGF